MSRRQFLGVVGTGVTGSLAGCGALSEATETEARVDIGDGQPAAEATAQFRTGLRRQGIRPDAEIPTDVEVEWTIRGINTGEHTAAKASPVPTPDGDVVIPGDNGELRRVTPAGDVVWQNAVDSTARGIHGTPAIANGTVYVGAYDGALYAFDLASGERVWRTELGGSIGSSPGYHDGTVYIAVEYPDPSGAMFAVDAITGDVTWDDQRVTDHPHSTCAIDRDAGRLVVGANDGVLYAWSYPDLAFEWEFQTGDAIKGPVATADGSAFFGSWDNRIYRVDLADGTEEWTFDTGRRVMSGPTIDHSTDAVYVGSHNGRLYALDIETGSKRWSFQTGGSITGCPTATDDHVLVGSYDHHCHAVSKADGERVWSIEGVGVMSSTPLVADGAVYVADRASEAYLSAGSTPETDGADGTTTVGPDSALSGTLYKIAPADT